MRRVWKETGSVNAREEFKQHLHIFVLKSQPTSETPSIEMQRALPWVNLMPRPSKSNLLALWHMTKFAQYPSDWAMYTMHMLEASQLAKDKKSFGPYWMLLPTPSLQCLAQTMVGLKRRITNEMFRDSEPWNVRDFERRVIESMEPFLIGEDADEADGSGEER